MRTEYRRVLVVKRDKDIKNLTKAVLAAGGDPNSVFHFGNESCSYFSFRVGYAGPPDKWDAELIDFYVSMVNAVDEILK